MVENENLTKTATQVFFKFFQHGTYYLLMKRVKEMDLNKTAIERYPFKSHNFNISKAHLRIT